MRFKISFNNALLGFRIWFSYGCTMVLKGFQYCFALIKSFDNVFIQGGFCQQKHSHRSADSKIGPGDWETRPKTKGERTTNSTIHRNSGTLPRPKGFLYQRPYRRVQPGPGYHLDPRAVCPCADVAVRVRVELAGRIVLPKLGRSVGPCKKYGFLGCWGDPGGPGGPLRAIRGPSRGLRGPPGSPRDLKQTKAKNLKT